MRRLIKKTLANNRGMALIVAVFAMVLTIAVASEVSYRTQVEYIASSHALNRIKAYYAAKAGIEFSLFRILLFKKAMAQFGDQLKDQKGLLDTIWQFPFSWPPVGLDDLNESEKEKINTVVKESALDSQYMVTIESEGSKIDINDLASKSEPLANAVKSQLLEIFKRELENNDAFKKKYQYFEFEDLINDIADWVDEDEQSRVSNGAESIRYEQPDDANVKLPPNSPFKSVAELHMVKGMEDEFFDLLKDKITVFGTKGVNVNYAPKDVLLSLDTQITSEIADQIIRRRTTAAEGGPFKDRDDFFSFLSNKGVRTNRLDETKVPLYFDAEYNFRIISSGMSRNVRRQITAISFDIDNITTRYVEILDELDKKDQGNQNQQNQQNQNQQNQQGQQNQKQEKKIPTGRPTVVYWEET